MVEHRDTIFVDGSFRRADAVGVIEVVNPSTEQVIATIPDCIDSDVDVAAKSALDSATGWAQTSGAERANYLERLAHGIEARAEVLPQLVTSQNGMPIAASRHANCHGPASVYRYYAELARTLPTEEMRAYRGGSAYVRREPVGVAALITPWNGPQFLLAAKLGPALAAGCPVVIKPAPETSLDAYLVCEAAREAQIPGGVVNMVTGGADTGAALVRDPRVRKVAFTGSTSAGRHIAAACAQDFKRATLELGGKSAAIVLDDVDLNSFAAAVPYTLMGNTGQNCRALTRVLVPRTSHDDLVDCIVEALAKVPLGDPTDESSVFGPLVSARQRDRVMDYIRIGIDEGARVALGGGRPAGFDRGFYVEPTVLTGVDNHMRVAREEIFGPVVCVIPYRDEAEAIAIANDSDYGLGGGVFTRDAKRGTGIARSIATGAVGVNTYPLPVEVPFGGIKQSGIGREFGPESVQAYQEFKAIYGVG